MRDIPMVSKSSEWLLEKGPVICRFGKIFAAKPGFDEYDEC